MKVEVRLVNEETVGLPAVNGHAAGIDVGSTEMWVTYSNLEGQTCQFMTGCRTEELTCLVEHLFNEGVTDVAMESTGIYGDSLRSMLEDRRQRQHPAAPAPFGGFIPSLAHGTRLPARGTGVHAGTRIDCRTERCRTGKDTASTGFDEHQTVPFYQ
jgi:hypothetical protein